MHQTTRYTPRPKGRRARERQSTRDRHERKEGGVIQRRELGIANQRNGNDPALPSNTQLLLAIYKKKKCFNDEITFRCREVGRFVILLFLHVDGDIEYLA